MTAHSASIHSTRTLAQSVRVFFFSEHRLASIPSTTLPISLVAGENRCVNWLVRDGGGRLSSNKGKSGSLAFVVDSGATLQHEPHRLFERGLPFQSNVECQMTKDERRMTTSSVEREKGRETCVSLPPVLLRAECYCLNINGR